MDIGQAPDLRGPAKVESQGRVRIPQQASEQGQVKDRSPIPPSAKKRDSVKDPNERAEAAPFDNDEMARVVKKVSEVLGRFNENVSVSLDQGTGMMVARVLNGATGDVIRQIPPQEILEVASRINEAVGLLIDHEA